MNITAILAVATMVAVLAPQERRIPRPDEDLAPAATPAAAPAPVDKGLVTTSRGTLEVQRCWLASRSITCSFLFTASSKRAVRLVSGRTFNQHYLLDEAERPHAYVNGYFVDAKGRPLPEVTLVQGESASLVQQFQAPTADVRTVRLIARGGRGNIADVPVERQR